MFNLLCLLVKIKRPVSRVAIIAPFAIMSQVGCVKMGGTLTKVASVNDFSKSQMLVLNSAVANGTDLVYVNVRLMNSDSSTVSDFTPTIAVESGGDILAPQCFASDKNGISVCPLRSLTAGRRTIRVQNLPKLALNKQIEFSSIPLRRDQVAVVTGASQTFTAGNYKVRATVSQNGGSLRKVAGKYTVYSSVQGSITAQTGNK